MFLKLLFLLICIIVTCCGHQNRFLEPGETFTYKPHENNENFQIFCYTGRPKYLIHIWQSVILQINHSTNDYTHYDGNSIQAVLDEYNANHYSWTLYLFSWKTKQINLNPFEQSCVGIVSSSEYTISLNLLRIDYWKVILLLTGIFVYISADQLSKNTVFHYVCGIVLGVCSSFLILIYFLSKLFPRKPVMYGVAACGWTVGIYLFQVLWDNIRVVLLNYKPYILGYFITTSLFSFIICYRWGPVQNRRTKNLIRWSLQSFGLLCIYLSTQFKEAAMGQIILVLMFYNIPPSWLTKTKKYWRRKFPPKIRLLTNEEYYQQGVRETTRALDELRKYCSSPECNQWRTALKLKDVKRFASFIEGSSHLSDEEILEYETSIQTTYLTDDDENHETEDESET